MASKNGTCSRDDEYLQSSKKSVCAGAFEDRACCRHDKCAKLSHRRGNSISHLASFPEVQKVKNCGSEVSQSSHRSYIGPPPKKASRQGWLKGPNLTFEKKGLVFFSSYVGSSTPSKKLRQTRKFAPPPPPSRFQHINPIIYVYTHIHTYTHTHITVAL